MECDGPYPQMDMQIVLPLCWGPFRLKVPSDVSIKQALGIVDLQRFADACFVQGRQISANAMTHTLRGEILYLGSPVRPPRPPRSLPVPKPVFDLHGDEDSFLGTAILVAHTTNLKDQRVVSVLCARLELNEFDGHSFVYFTDMINPDHNLGSKTRVCIKTTCSLPILELGRTCTLHQVRWNARGEYFWYCAQQSSFCRSLRETPRFPLAVCETFAGGYAGWSRAINADISLKDLFTVKTAIDHDTIAAEVYAKNFSTEVTTTESFLSMPIIPLHTFLCEDFNARSMHLIQNIQQHEIWTASLPCQPWSSASRKAGLNSPEGRVWHEFARAISIARPRCILLENVAPLVEHEHWPVLRNLFTDAKYRIAWQTVQDGLEHASCTNRRRWLAILIDSLTPFRDPAPFTVMWQALQPIKLSLRAVVPLSLPPSHRDSLTLDPDTLERYAHPRFMRKGDTFASRDVCNAGRLATAMAAYTTQHDLPDDLLQEKGLFGQIVNCHPDANMYRFLSPFETALALVNTDFLILPEDVKSAARMVGNAISVCHATIVLCQCINVYARAGIICYLNPETCIARLLLRKMTRFNADVSQYGQGWIIMDRSTPPTTPGQVQPHPVSSSQIVSPTQQFKSVVEITCVTPSGLSTAKHTAGGQAQQALDVTSYEGQQLFIRRCNGEPFAPCDWLSTVDSDSVCIALPLEAPWNFHQACEVACLLESIHESNLNAIRARKMQQFHVMLFHSTECLLDITIPLEDVHNVRSKIGKMPVSLDLDTHLPVPCMFSNPIHCWLVDLADLPVPGYASHAPTPKRRCLDQSVPHSAHDTHIAPVPNFLRLAIGFAGDHVEEICVDPRETIWTIAQSWCGEKAVALREIRSNGNQIARDQLPDSVDGQVIRCFLVGVPGGAKQHIKSQLAQIFIQGSIPSKLVAPIVAQTVSAVPVLNAIVNANDGIDKHEALCTLARSHGINIPIPEHTDRENKPAAIRPNSKGKGKGKHKVQSFEPKDFRLDPSFFARSTGGEIGIASEISSMVENRKNSARRACSHPHETAASGLSCNVPCASYHLSGI